MNSKMIKQPNEASDCRCTGYARHLVLIAMLFSACGNSQTDEEGRALPSDANVVADVRPRDQENVIEVAAVKNKSGEAYFHPVDLAWYFDRGVVIRRKANIADLPDAVLVVGGLARYAYNGDRYEYLKFLVSYNEYEGIPRPSNSDLDEFVENHLANVFVSQEHKVLGVSRIQQVPDANWIWHSPTSFSVLYEIHYRFRTSDTSIDERNDTFEVRFYRNSVDAPLHALLATERSRTVLDTRMLNSNDINAMKTLRTNFR